MMERTGFLWLTEGRGYWKYIIAFFLIALATAIKLTLFSTLGAKTPFLLYFAVIIFVSRYYGVRSAVFSSILTVVVADYFFFEPYYSLSLTANGGIQCLVFLLECFCLVCICSFREEASRRASDTQKMFQILIEKSSDGIMMVKLDGRMAYLSPSVSRITGFDSSELQGVEFWSLLLPEEITNVKEQFYHIASHSGESVHLLHQLKHRSGHSIWIESTVTNLIDEPLVQSLIINFTDITERVVRERQMEDFIGIASHELKTPLTSLKAYTQVLDMRMKKENNATSGILVSKIEQQINRVVSMIFDLLDVTKLQSGIMHLNIVPFEINELIDEIVESMQNSGQNHQIDLKTGPSVVIKGDRVRIGQVLTNLISNGIKYSPGSASVVVSSEVKDRHIRISVTDHGIGIPPGEIRNVFKRFYRVNSVKESFQGLGLGLYISHQIVERHGGDMGVVSEVNKGSTFWFSLPLY